MGDGAEHAAEDRVQSPRAERARKWREDNAGAIADYNRFIESEGIPLAEYRKF